MRKLELMIVGFGNIGRGVAKVLALKRGELYKKYGLSPSVVAICEYNGCVVDERGANLSEALRLAGEGKLHKHRKWTRESTLDVIRERRADIVIEVTPTNIQSGEPGMSHMLAALGSRKHLVTSNKGPLALNFKKLAGTADRNGVLFRYEATVGGGMPIFNLARKTLQLNEILSIKGILNGTTNFILSKMHEEGVPFEVALENAKDMKIAEADPSYDVDAIDPAAKLVILANALMGMEKTYKDVKRVGIRGITPEAITLAKRNGCSIKLVGEVCEGALEVTPHLVPLVHPLNVGGTLNALMLRTDLAREIFIVGRGAGQMETASAILSDVLDIASETS